MARPVKKKISIEEAAIKLFAQKGITGTVIKDIALEAGVTEGALYRHYVGKDEMAWQLFTRELELFSRDLVKIFAEGAEIKETLKNGITYIYNYYKKEPHRLAFVLLSQHNFPEEKWLEEEINPTAMIIKVASELKLPASYKKADPALIGAMMMGIVLQPIVLHRYGRLKGDILAQLPGVIEGMNRLLGL